MLFAPIDEEEVRVVSMNDIDNYWCKPQEPFPYTTPLLHILGNGKNIQKYIHLKKNWDSSGLKRPLGNEFLYF